MATAIELTADRFVVFGGDAAIDLATGDRVTLLIGSAGGPSDQARWTGRCDALFRLRHGSLARLIDYGPFGETRRFEAWRCGAAWHGSRDTADEAVRRASGFLRGCARSEGRLTASCVRSSPDGAVVLIDDEAGYEIDQGSQGSKGSRGSKGSNEYGVAILPRRAIPIVSALFAGVADPRPQTMAICGDRRSGRSTVLHELARIARLAGIVPVAARLLDQPTVKSAVAGRTLFIIDDEGTGGWSALLGACIATPKPHLLVCARREEVRHVNGVALERFDPASLVSAVQPAPALAMMNRVRHAAEQAHGLPGRFVDALWPAADVNGAARTFSRVSRAAEQPAVYGESGIADTQRAIDRAPIDRWPIPSELAALRQRMTAGIELGHRGRHASGERLLRQSLGALARRGDWTHAGRGSAALASSLLKRGRPREAQAAITDANEYWQRVGDEAALIECAMLAGSAWIDVNRLDEAESVLGAGLAAARSSSHQAIDDVSLVLARCSFWRARYADADRLIDGIAQANDRVLIRAAAARSRIAVGLRDLPRAVSFARDALDRARTLIDAASIATAACAAAFAHLAVGDLDACDRDAAACVDAVHRTHEPLRAIRARLLAAEAARRRGRLQEARTLIARVSRLTTPGLPPIVAARVALLKACVETEASPEEIAAKHARATGLDALTLFIPVARESRAAIDPSLDGLLEILSLCQNADEERTVLAEVCRRLRQQLHAAAVAFFGREGGTVVPLAADGGRIDAPIVDRSIAAGIAIAPHYCDGRLEGAAPIKYGGDTIGSLAARWSPGTTRDLSGSAAALMMAAAAAGPIVAAILAHAAQPQQRAGPGAVDIIGASAAINDVRLSIARASRAPFPVLIEGESGSGKELVARALHRSGQRRDRPFCTLNCAALPDDLVEAELFGHARGAFTGAVAERPGVFEEAHTGTLFLDEIGELSLRAQAKVLRVIQEGELRRIGENSPRRVDVRTIAATNRDLRVEAAAARFRMDLLYRLDVIRIVVPPLRDRREDIALLAEHFWRDAAARVGSRATLSAATMAALARYDWPGNVRELQNVLAALAVRTPKRGVVPPTALPSVFSESRAGEAWRLDDARRGFEERFVRAALVRAGGHRARAASELGVTRQGLTKLMVRLGIERRE